ncbi:survival of motor neuron-related-splicing factor 30 [Galendromus occidentalis]|uniref:Survival of motor neuron-related-splicing factor 30 n=1 Tax=Galendromus occidentalis TaxID=34638 RepID=A0AAJ7L523_9ACAR|nr:survival of motor neuron-related-splicing factor 30 [Galendromus occidentalis]
MADKGELQAQLETYNVQLQQVEAALASSPDDPDLKKLREDLLEVVSLTRNLLGDQATSRGSPGEAAQGNSSVAKWQVGDKVLAPWNEDGNHYDATVTSISGDGLATVTFDAYGAHETCNLNELRPRDAQIPKGSKKAQLAAQKEYKKQKALKKKERLKEIEQQREADKNKWQSFNMKALHKKKGVTKKSIFATPETVDGRVGIGTCGIADKPMTEYQQVEKHQAVKKTMLQHPYSLPGPAGLN